MPRPHRLARRIRAWLPALRATGTYQAAHERDLSARLVEQATHQRQAAWGRDPDLTAVLANLAATVRVVAAALARIEGHARQRSTTSRDAWDSAAYTLDQAHTTLKDDVVLINDALDWTYDAIRDDPDAAT